MSINRYFKRTTIVNTILLFKGTKILLFYPMYFIILVLKIEKLAIKLTLYAWRKLRIIINKHYYKSYFRHVIFNFKCRFVV